MFGGVSDVVKKHASTVDNQLQLKELVVTTAQAIAVGVELQQLVLELVHLGL